MLGIIGKSLHKNKRLVHRKSEKNGNGKLSGILLDYLEKKYHLLPWEMLRLRTLSIKGSAGNLTVYYVRVYDQETALQNGIFIKTYNDLDKQSGLILYHGYILDNGVVYVTKCDVNAVCQSQ